MIELEPKSQTSFYESVVNYFDKAARHTGLHPGLLEQIALSLLSLKFSRSNEQEADMYSVTYLCPTEYKADGAAAFFIKMEGQPSPPEFLSTHPSPANRVRDIENRAQELNCRGKSENESAYSRIKRSL